MVGAVPERAQNFVPDSGSGIESSRIAKLVMVSHVPFLITEL